MLWLTLFALFPILAESATSGISVVCPVGTAAASNEVKDTSGGRPVVAGRLSDVGIKVTIGGVELNATAKAVNVPANADLLLTVGADDLSYLELLVRVEAPDMSIPKLIPEANTVRADDICKPPAVGITNVGLEEKTLSTAVIRFDEPVENVAFDVTVVFLNTDVGSAYVYDRYRANFVIEAEPPVLTNWTPPDDSNWTVDGWSGSEPDLVGGPDSIPQDANLTILRYNDTDASVPVPPVMTTTGGVDAGYLHGGGYGTTAMDAPTNTVNGVDMGYIYSGTMTGGGAPSPSSTGGGGGGGTTPSAPQSSPGNYGLFGSHTHTTSDTSSAGQHGHNDDDWMGFINTHVHQGQMMMMNGNMMYGMMMMSKGKRKGKRGKRGNKHPFYSAAPPVADYNDDVFPQWQRDAPIVDATTAATGFFFGRPQQPKRQQQQRDGLFSAARRGMGGKRHKSKRDRRVY